MRKVLMAAVLAFCLSVVPSVRAHNDTVSRVLPYTHEIEESTLLETGKCSATAIGPHALLTASHCELPTNKINIDGTAAGILSLKRDDNDHTIYFVDREFKSWAKVNETLPDIGDEVFIVGNPAEFTGIFRHGYVSLVKVPDEMTLAFSDGNAPTVIVYDINAFPGDSGSGMFNEAGEVQGVLSASITEELTDQASGQSTSMKLIVGLQLTFSPQDLKDAQTYGIQK